MQHKILTGVVIGIVLGVVIVIGVQQAMIMNARVTGIEKFLQQAISQSQQAKPISVAPTN